LEQITPMVRAHPDVLLVRWDIYAKAKKWEMAAEVARGITEILPEKPFGWVHWAFSLHELKRTKEAWDVLFPVVDKFPDEHIIRYNLACYACQLGNLKDAEEWLKKAFDVAGKKDIRAMALEDPDLQPLWDKIGEIIPKNEF
jgi:predicted Zn-dependent protease